MRNLLIFFLFLFLAANSLGIPANKPIKNILLINSYHQGYAWTDSVTSGIISALKSNPDIVLHIKNLESKQFGQSKFEVEKKHIQEIYSGITFDGVLVADNDALDFAFKYDQDLFPNVPIVFAGISNPEDYPLEGSRYYGFKEIDGSNQVLPLVREILPKAKRLLVITDLSTTGKIYRKLYSAQAARMGNFGVVFPEVIDEGSICRLVGSGAGFDAIYYIGINQDKDGNPVDFIGLFSKITMVAKVPVLTDDPQFVGQGVVGGFYQSGKKHGFAAGNLLIRLLNGGSPEGVKRFDTCGYDYFFDWQMLKKYNIPLDQVPAGSHVFNRPAGFKREYLLMILAVMTFLIILVAYLLQTVRRIKGAKLKISIQFKEIQVQKTQLEDAYQQLNGAIAELENANGQLKEKNISLSEAKKKAEESDNLKSAFLANVSHEIRTPLNSIVGFSSLLNDSDLDDGTRKSYIDLIESNTESLLVLIDEIIDLSKIEAQQLTLKKLNFSIDLLMSELFQIFSQSHNNPHVELRMKCISGSKELLVFSDRVRVKQIFINLLSNANKFTNSGFIEFGYREDDVRGIVLYVRDTGIGISSEFHQAVFHRFRKLNENTGKLFRGTGLGLAITLKLVELLGGEIWIESTPGNGAIFFFTLSGLVLEDNRK